MTDAVPEPIFPEDDPYPAYRTSAPLAVPTRAAKPNRSPIDEYVLTAIVATGTVIVERKLPRRVTEL